MHPKFFFNKNKKIINNPTPLSPSFQKLIKLLINSLISLPPATCNVQKPNSLQSIWDNPYQYPMYAYP